MGPLLAIHLERSTRRQLVTDLVGTPPFQHWPGTCSDVFGFLDQGVALRVSGQDQASQVLRAYALAQYLVDQDIPALAPTNVTETPSAIIATFPLCDPFESAEQPQAWKSAATLAVRLHTLTPPPGFEEITMTKPATPNADQRHAQMTLTHPQLSSALRESLAHVELVLQARAPADQVLVHGDVHPGNVVCHQGQVLLCDFDRAGLGHREDDWSAYWAWACHHNVTNDLTATITACGEHLDFELLEQLARCHNLLNLLYCATTPQNQHQVPRLQEVLEL